MDAIQLIYLVPLLPLIGCLINGLARNVLSKTLIGIIGSAVVLIPFLISVGIFFQVSNAGFVTQNIHYFDFIHAVSEVYTSTKQQESLQ